MSAVEMLDAEVPGLRIKIVGVGGAGNNAIDRMKLEELSSVHLLNINTDYKTLAASPVPEKLLIGHTVTRGLSAGGEADIGRESAEADRGLIAGSLDGVDLVFLLVGLGGGTGSGAAPVVARCAEEAGAIVVAFATLPFAREGSRRVAQAEHALGLLRECCHAVITLPNDVLLQEIPDEATVLDAFSLADDWIRRGVLGLWSMLFQSGLINVDFATLRQAFSVRGGKTLFGIGSGEGGEYVAQALSNLEVCPLLHLPENRYVRQADSLVVNIRGGPDLTMAQVNEVMDFVTDRFGSKDNTVFGAVIEEDLAGRLEITVIGTTTVEGSVRRYRSRRAPEDSATVHANGTAAHASANHSTTTGQPQAGQPAGKRSSHARNSHSANQNEFDFPGLEESRGHFEKTDHNLYEGADLDVPTYLRRGVKISVN